MDLIRLQRNELHIQRSLPQVQNYQIRLNKLKRLGRTIAQHESAIGQALTHDLGRNAFDNFMLEMGVVDAEIKNAIRSLASWMEPQSVLTPVAMLPGRSEIHYEPFGVCLIIGPFNYPFQLIMAPLVGAIAAGNAIIVKPSEQAPAVEAAVREMIISEFKPEEIAVVGGGAETVQSVIGAGVDFVFFTGSTLTGKKIMMAAAESLTPVCLELGGKSPCIVDGSIEANLSARRIAWGKFTNAGQTCVAPDYVLVHKRYREALLEGLKRAIASFYGADPLKSPDLGKVINQKSFERLVGLMKSSEVLYGGQRDEQSLKIAPTLVEATIDSSIMKEEIFGPVLPIFAYDQDSDIANLVSRSPNPLALYIFSAHQDFVDRMIQLIPAGGVTVNDCLMHVGNPNLPFGGRGAAGMGQYHGRFSFETFSHRKAVLRKSRFFDFSFRYPPYDSSKLRWLKRFLR